MPHDPKKCLFDILDAGKKIAEFTAGLCFDDFAQNALVQSAVHMQCIIIGEALMRIRSTDQTIYGGITDADRIIAFRHVIAHGYDVIIDDIVWEIIQDKIPLLLNEAQILFNA